MRDVSIYNVHDLRRYLDHENFGLLLDTANEKYNQAIWRKYANWGTPSDSKNWIQGEKEVPILVRASLLGTHSQKPQRSTTGWKYYGGSTVKMGHGFSIDEDDLFQLRENAKLTDVPYAQLMTDTLIQNSQNMLGGIHAELNYLTLQALSTGEIKDVTVDGTSYDFKFQIPDDHFLEPTTMWFKQNGEADETADPVQDILDFQDILTDDKNMAVDHWKVSKKLLKKILRHPSVLKAVLARANYYNPDNVKLTDADILQALHANGVWDFDVIDAKSGHEEDGVFVADKPAFDEHMLTAASRYIVPFEMKCTNSIYVDRQTHGQIAASTNYQFVEDRIAVLSTWEERPQIKNTVDFELYAAPVFNNLREFGFAKVWATE